MPKYRTKTPDLVASVRDIEKRTSKMERTPQIGNAAVDSGAFVVIHPNGNVIASMGKVVVDGLDQWGIVTYRPDGTIASTSVSTEAGESSFTIRDKMGSTIFQVDDDFGISIPQMLYGVTKTADIVTPPATTTSATFAALWTVHGIVQSPQVKVRYLLQNPGGTTSEVRLTDPTRGTVLAGPISHGSGFYDYTNIVGPLESIYADDRFKVDLEVRRASGAGTVATLAVYASSASST